MNDHMDFLLYELGSDFLLNGNAQRGLFVEATEKIAFYDDLILTSEIPFETGSVILYKSVTWLVISQVQNNEDMDTSIYRARIRKCSNNALTLNVSGILHTVPIIVTDKISLNIDSSTYISSLDTEIYILIQNNSLNNNIKINDVYKIGRLNYSVQNIDDLNQPGLLYIKLEFTATEQVLPVYSISITNGESLTTDTVTPVQINIEQKDHDTILTEPLPVVYATSDDFVAIIDVLGLVTPVSVGSVTITVALESDLSVNDSISLVVEEIPVADNFTASITGATSIIKTYSSTYTCIFKNNSVAITDTSVFYLTGDDGISVTSFASITAQDGVANTCVVKGLNLGYVKLFCKNTSETILSDGFRIQIKSLF